MHSALHWVACSLGAVGVALALVGCFHAAEDCELNPILDCGSWAITGTGSGTGGGTPIGCVPSENAKPVEETCGIFISSSKGKDGNAGTKSAPLATLQQAIDKAKGRPVYACAEAFAGSVTLASGSAIYGGLDCSEGWAYVGATTKSALTGDADKSALTLASTAKGAEVADFTITASNATAPGGSSIAVLADQVTASLSRCDLVAGDGAAGADGADALSAQAEAGADGSKGGDACSADTVNGGAQVENGCGMESSIGGNGGNGNKSNGSDGSAGQPGTLGKAGLGEPATSGAWSCAAEGAGQGGETGKLGDAGIGASMTDLGTLTSSGFASAGGGDGQLGKIGQGGGGGGGAKGDSTAMGMLCGSAKPVGGASGGSGGAGGCGGVGGKGGKGGGASLALVSLQASLTLSEVTLKTGSGGKGGAGGKSQAGGTGGLGGTGGSNLSISGLKAGCDGGKGGPGGDGGSGGGGRGGHAIGLAYTGMAPTIGMEQITLGTAGKGGFGGNGNLSGNQGADGVAAPMQVFP
jgi:hypothetical protein